MKNLVTSIALVLATVFSFCEGVNVVFMIADDLNTDLMEQNPLFSTSNVYTQAYSQIPVCGPSRASIHPAGPKALWAGLLPFVGAAVSLPWKSFPGGRGWLHWKSAVRQSAWQHFIPCRHPGRRRGEGLSLLLCRLRHLPGRLSL